MLVLLGFTQIIHRLFTSNTIQQVKPFTLHCSLLFLVFIYAFLGGLVFNKLEADAVVEQNKRDLHNKLECVSKIFNKNTNKIARSSSNGSVDDIVRCFQTEVDVRSQWSFVTATLYGFGIVTTLGYNRIAPVTLAGRLFCVVYGLCGIPMTMIIIANIGQYLNQFAGATRKTFEVYRERKRLRRASIKGEDIPESSIELVSICLLITFLVYVAFGALLLPLLNGEFDFLNGIYFNFLCLTAIDFGQLVPARVAFLPITFLYVCIGLAITTIAIDIGSEYLKKLHNFGKKMKNVATTKIWFGGKTLKVKDLLHAVGKKCGIDPYVIDNMDLENIVERAVALNEGRELPEEILPPNEPSPEPSIQADFNDSLPPKKDPFLTPPITVRRHFVETISDTSTSPTTLPTPTKPFDNCRLVAIDIDNTDGFAEEQALDWSEPVIVVGRPQQCIVERAAEIESPDKLEFTIPTVILDEVNTSEIEEPKKFKEKKQKYGRDPKKLLATYQEEWDRLERVSDRKLGPRRKSVLALNSINPAAMSASPSLPLTSTERMLSQRSLEEGEGEVPHTFADAPAATRSHSPTPTKIKKKVLAPSVYSSTERRFTAPVPTSPTAARYLAAAASNAERRDSAAASSRRSSSSAGIKKINPSIYRKFGEVIIPKKDSDA